MSEFIPTLDSSGTFEFKKPISEKVNHQTLFTCKSIRKISELISSNVDVLANYYIANSLSETTYEQDKNNDISIVGLYSDTFNWLYVPSSQIVSYPDSSGVPYRRTCVAINLGPIETSIDLEDLQNVLADVVKTHLGITPTTRIISLSEIAMVSREDHEAINKARKGKLEIDKTTYLELAKLKTLVNQLTERNKFLEDYVLKIN